MNTFNGGYPAQNPYFGSISPNGLNLGLVNVNPLVSFQFAKDEYGQKTFKPLVNLHVTPNENLINKVGNLFKAKKYGYGNGGQSSYNQHYHTHTHYPGTLSNYHMPHHYEGPPHHYEGPTHFQGPHHYEHGPQYGSHYGPTEYYPTGQFGSNEYGFSGPGGIYRDGSTNHVDSGITAPAYDFDPNTNTYFSRSANGSTVDRTYANHFANYKQNNVQNVALANKNLAQGNGQSVSFPSSRRKRSADNLDITSNIETETNYKSIRPKVKYIEKVKKNYYEEYTVSI